MTIRREDESLDWRIISKIFLMPAIGLLLSIIGIFLSMTLSEIKASMAELKAGQKEIQAVQAGVLRANDLQDNNIKANTKLIEDKMRSMQETIDEFNTIKKDYYRRFGYISTTRSGEEVLLKHPMQ